MQQYLKLLQHIIDTGNDKSDRTGTGTRSVFGYQMRFNLADGFPLVTTKKCHLKSIIYELLWFLQGDTNISYLKEHNVKIWDEWADENGDLGPVYGKQWRSWQGADGVEVDQVKELIHTLKTNPDSRRMIISAWNVAELPKMKLMPCHCLFQFYVKPPEPLKGGTKGDVHLYNNHFEQANLQLTRTPYPLPQMKINPEIKDIFDFKFEDFELLNYESHPAIKAPVAV